MARNRWIGCCAGGCLAGILLPVIGAYLLFRMNTETPEVEQKPPPSPVEAKQAEARLDDLRTESEHAVRAAKKGQKVPFKFVISEKDLNTFIATDPEFRQKFQEKGFEDVRVDFGEGTASLEGRLPIGSRRLWGKLGGHLTPGTGGRIIFVPSSMELGRMKFNPPESTQKQIMEKIQQDKNGAILRVPGDIKKLTIHNDTLTLEGVTDPAILQQMEADQKAGRVPGSSTTKTTVP